MPARTPAGGLCCPSRTHGPAQPRSLPPRCCPGCQRSAAGRWPELRGTRQGISAHPGGPHPSRRPRDRASPGLEARRPSPSPPGRTMSYRSARAQRLPSSIQLLRPRTQVSSQCPLLTKPVLPPTDLPLSCLQSISPQMSPHFPLPQLPSYLVHLVGRLDPTKV